MFINMMIGTVYLGLSVFFFFFQAEDGIRDLTVTGVQTCALPISRSPAAGTPRRPGDRAAARAAALPPRRSPVLRRARCDRATGARRDRADEPPPPVRPRRAPPPDRAAPARLRPGRPARPDRRPAWAARAWRSRGRPAPSPPRSLSPTAASPPRRPSGPAPPP